MLAGVFIALATGMSIWAPIWSHYFVEETPLAADHIELSRQHPGDEVLRELGTLKHNLVPPIGPDHEDPVAVARDLIAESEQVGRSSLFDPEYLAGLNYAGLETLRVLLAAYESSGDPVFLATATRFLVDFARFERSAWLPRGLLWNDHAVGVRAVALAEFWRIYRHSPGFNEDTARLLLEHVVSTANRLADPRHYTFASNHGTMQNVGLLHLSLAFPQLPWMARHAELAIERQREQLTYLFGPEGAWRENSAGYHKLGLELTGIFLRYMTLANLDIPPAMRHTYEAASAYYGALRAADGSLPAIGDTSYATHHREPLTTAFDAAGRASEMTRVEPEPPGVKQRLFADLGQAVWWSADEHRAQTVVTWSNFTRHGHKHADELSLNLRSAAGRWWTSVGYWPLDHELRHKARSWSGSNAPHLADEAEHSARSSSLLGYGWSKDLAAIHLRRAGPGAFLVERQIVYVEPSTWLILDTFDDNQPRDARIVWGVDHDVDILPGPSRGSFMLSRQGSPTQMLVQVLASGALEPKILRGSVEPFAGWVEHDYRPVPASAIVLTPSSAGTWTALVSRLQHPSGAREPGPVRMPDWTGSTSWRLEIHENATKITVTRDGPFIRAARGGDLLQLELSAAPAASAAARHGEQIFAAAAARYGGHFANNLTLRWKLTLLLLVLLVGHVAVMLLLRHVRPQYATALGLAAIAAWLISGLWLHMTYPLGLL
jgi:hypothetical protein